MSMIIEKKLAAETTSRSFDRGTWPKTIVQVGTLGASVIAVNVVDESGAVVALYDDAGTAVTLTATSQPLKLDSPIDLQFVKPETVAAAGVMLKECR